MPRACLSGPVWEFAARFELHCNLGPPQSSVDRSVGHGADFFFHFRGFHHDDGVPGAAVEEAAIGPLAETLLAADAKNRIDLNAAEGRMILVGNPEHAVFNGAIFNAGRGAGATGAAFGDDGEFLGLFLARRGDAFGAWLVL